MNDNDLLEYIRSYQNSTEKEEILKKISELQYEQFKYLLRYGDNADWFVEADILISLGYPCVKPVIDEIFEWLQDMNWPGAADIQDKLLLKLEKTVLVNSLSIALRRAYWNGDSMWIYWLSSLASEANLSRDDFAQTDNAYDIVLFYNALYVDDIPTFNYIELLHSWRYPRIKQFIYYVVKFLRQKEPNTQIWEQHIDLLKIVPENIRTFEIKKALRQMHDVGGMDNIGYLKEIISLGGTTEDFLEYISS
jgi:hypothetical protein